MRSSTLARLRHAMAGTALALAVTSCGDDGPSGPSASFDIVGQWDWRVTNAEGSGVTCSVNNVTLTFARNDGVLTGSRFSSGGNNLVCTTGGATTHGNFTTNTSVQNLIHSGTTISYEFATSSGLWEMDGSIEDDDRMGGTATIRVNGPQGGTIALTGPWTGTR